MYSVPQTGTVASASTMIPRSGHRILSMILFIGLYTLPNIPWGLTASTISSTTYPQNN